MYVRKTERGAGRCFSFRQLELRSYLCYDLQSTLQLTLGLYVCISRFCGVDSGVMGSNLKGCGSRFLGLRVWIPRVVGLWISGIVSLGFWRCGSRIEWFVCQEWGWPALTDIIPTFPAVCRT